MKPWAVPFLVALSGALAAGPFALAEMPDPGAIFDEGDDLPDMIRLHGFDVLPLSEVARIAAQRFEGKLISARLMPPSPAEHARGVELVHELRLLTPDRDVLLLRLDARSGDFLEAAGAGLTRARRPVESDR